MTTREEFLDFVRTVGADDRGVCLALSQLVRRADDDGTVRRGAWMASLERAFHHGGGALGAGVTDTSEDATDAFRAMVDERVIPPLEEAGVAHREPADENWDFLIIESGLWGALAPDRDGLVAAIEEAIGVGETSPGAPGAPEPIVPGAALVEGGSRFYGEGLTKIYRRRKVVNEADLSVQQGEIVGLLGPNGAGKTTTFYMMVGLIPPAAGKVYLDGEDLTRVPMYQRARRGVGYLAQEPSVFRKLTVEDNVLAILETLDLPKDEKKARLEELLDELSLSALRNNKAYSLSGGERRRLEITRALVQRPKFMLLDEPFAGIDPIAVNDIQQIVSGLRHRGIGVVISDHNVEQTLEIVDRAYIMYEGRIRVSGTV